MIDYKRFWIGMIVLMAIVLAVLEILALPILLPVMWIGDLAVHKGWWKS